MGVKYEVPKEKSHAQILNELLSSKKISLQEFMRAWGTGCTIDLIKPERQFFKVNSCRFCLFNMETRINKHIVHYCMHPARVELVKIDGRSEQIDSTCPGPGKNLFITWDLEEES